MVKCISNKIHRKNERTQDGTNSILLKPSPALFEKLDHNLVIHDLKTKVLKSIRKREKILDEIHAKCIFEGEEVQIDAKVLFRLYDISVTVVENIIAAETLHCHKKDSRNEEVSRGSIEFLWEGKSYILKMLTDVQFISRFPNVRDILSLEKKNLYHNPFLLPLDINEIVGYEPENTRELAVRMNEVPWKVDVEKMKRLSCRILFEKYPDLYEDKEKVEVATNDVGSDMVELIIPAPPSLNFVILERVAQSHSLMFDDALVLCFARLLLGIDQFDTTNCPFIPKGVVLTLARRRVQDIDKKFRSMAKSDSNVYVKKKIVIALYSMMSRHLLKLELLRRKLSRPLDALKSWVMSVVSKRCQVINMEVESTVFQYPQESIATNFDSRPSMYSPLMNKSVGLEEIDDDVDSEVKSNSFRKDPSSRQKVFLKDYIPFPISCVVRAKEGDCKLTITAGDVDAVGVVAGEMIRIGHPVHSYTYTVISNENITSKKTDSIHISEPFDHSPVLYEEFVDKDQKVALLHDPYVKIKQKCGIIERSNPMTHSTILDQESKLTYTSITPESIDDRAPLSFVQLRVWRLVPSRFDKRLDWRKAFDNGFVPWQHFTKSIIPSVYLRVKVDFANIERQCFDSFSSPNSDVNQQRLQYFEKVSLNEIMMETYTAVCDWHPVSSHIDIFKWAKLARKMKFLSKIKNSNHEVDMAFLRHSYNRRLSVSQFKSVLLDMATLKFPSSRYTCSEALANMLWSTVVMLPRVNKMIWTKAQEMALRAQMLRVCAQTRIAARLRMIHVKTLYCEMRIAAMNIQKYTRRMSSLKAKRRKLRLAALDRRYRIRYCSSIVCQKYWRQYKYQRQFRIYKSMRKRMLKEARAKRRKKLQRKFARKMRNVLFRRVLRIQSFLTITWIVLRDRRIFGEEIQIEIQVYVLQTHRAYHFTLDERGIRQCMEAVILRKGPLSWDEMLQPSSVSQFTTRLSIRMINKQPTVEFCSSGIVEKGDLIDNRVVAFGNVKHIMSMYRSASNVVIRLYDSNYDCFLREKINILLLSEWIVEEEEQRRTGMSNALKFCELVQMKKQYMKYEDDELLESHICTDLGDCLLHCRESKGMPEIMESSNESKLISWLLERIEIRQDEETSQTKMILKYESEAERIEGIAKRLQSIWRGKCAKKRAKEEVYKQYEKHFDRESKTFFYVHKRTDTKQWSKPAVLADNNDVADPPDEWRVAIYFDHETNDKAMYYFNPFTGQSSWLSEEDAARMVQRAYRARQTQELLNGGNLDFKQVVKAVMYEREIEAKYEQHPNKLSNEVNFALLNHCLRFNLEIAKTIYKIAVTKSPCHPVIARAYGLFILATCESPIVHTFEKSCKMFEEASAIDPGAVKFQVAREQFFYWSVVMHPNDPVALLNYALLHQCILGDYYRAEKIYRRALAQDSTNAKVIINYDLFIDQRYPGGYYANYGVPEVVVGRSEVKDEKPEWGEWKLMLDPMCTKPSFDTFWLNSIDHTSSFEEPDWKHVWQKRLERSKRLSTSSKSLWVEYLDPRLKRKFVFNRVTEEYTWKEKI